MQNYKPSKQYLENIEYYKKMHLEGYNLIDGRKRSPQDAYDGKSTLIYATLIKEIIKKNNIKNILDYGCGKAFYYENKTNLYDINNQSLKQLWQVDIDLYDPCYEDRSNIEENKKYDLVLCIDVLEHIPQIDIDWVLNRLISKANKYLFINVACYPAIALLPNGENAHINLNNPDWWHKKILKLKKNNKFCKIICICTLKENGEVKYFPLQYDDKLSNYNTK